MPERLDMLDINKTQVVFGSEVPLELYYQNFPNIENDKLYQLKDRIIKTMVWNLHGLYGFILII